jgi:ATP-dependent Lhr-like helicase
MAAELLLEGRKVFREVQLDRRSTVQEDRDLHLFLWKGSQTNAVFGVALAMAGCSAEPHDFGVTLPKTTASQAESFVANLSTPTSLSPDDVSAFVENIRVGKFSEFAPESLLRAQWARQNAGIIEQIPEIALSTLSGQSGDIRPDATMHHS